MAATPHRPRQVTLAGWMIMVGSAVVVFSAFERVSGLRSIESQEAVADFLSEPPGDGLGLSVDQVLDLIQLLSLVAGGLRDGGGDPGVLGAEGLQGGPARAGDPRGAAAGHRPRHRGDRVVAGRRGGGDAVGAAGPELVRGPAAADAARPARGRVARRPRRRPRHRRAPHGAGRSPRARPPQPMSARRARPPGRGLGLRAHLGRAARSWSSGWASPCWCCWSPPTCCSTSCTGRTPTSPTRACPTARSRWRRTSPQGCSLPWAWPRPGSPSRRSAG